MSIPEHLIYEHVVQTSKSVLCIEFDVAGKVLNLNDCAQALLGDGALGGDYRDVFLDFEGDLTFESLVKGGHSPRLLSLPTATSMPQSFLFRFIKTARTILAFGELDCEEVERLRLHLVDANNELSNLSRDLQKANVDLQRLNDIKNEFLGMAAHDLRSPIGNIASLSELLLEDGAEVLPDMHVDFLNTIKQLSEFMLTMLENLLDISALESGKMRINLASEDFRGVLEHAVHLSALYAGKKGIEIALELPDTPLPKIRMDTQKIRQVLDNLISNAVKFSPHGSSVTVAAELAENELVISVRDQGCGIREEDMSKLFKPFTRTAAQTTGGEKSTGLGLSIVKRIVDGHAGRIWAQNVPEGGAVFYFALPLEESHA